MLTKRFQTIDITLIHLDLEIYPREKVSEELVETYRQSMEAGEKFPPLVVQKDSYTLIDGRHRYEALKKLGKKEVDVEILDIPDPELRAEAVRRNIKQGKRLTAEELRKNIIDLRFRDKKSLKEIAEIVGRTEGRISQICDEYEMSSRHFNDFNSKDRKKPIDLRKKVDAKKKEEILEDLKTGLSGKEIAEKYNVSQPTVSHIKREHDEWISGPVYIKGLVSRIEFFFKVIFANKLLKKARLEFKEGGVLVGNSNGEKPPLVVALFKDDYFEEYKVDQPIDAYVVSDVLTQLPVRKYIEAQSVELVLVNENTWKLRYDDCEKTHEYKNLDWRDFPLPALELDADGIPTTVQVKAKASPQYFPRNEKGNLTLQIEDGKATCSFKCRYGWDCKQTLKLEFLEKKGDATAYFDLTMFDEILKIRNSPFLIGMWSDQTRIAIGYGSADCKVCFILG